jgi:hypothetical protein
VDGKDWQALLGALDDRDADVMVEAKGKERALFASSQHFSTSALQHFRKEVTC